MKTISIVISDSKETEKEDYSEDSSTHIEVEVDEDFPTKQVAAFAALMIKNLKDVNDTLSASFKNNQ